ncbi:MAG: hypothetical protein ACK4Z7_12630, partial [Novosphingobium sp.]
SYRCMTMRAACLLAAALALAPAGLGVQAAPMIEGAHHTARFGPFVVLSTERARLVGVTDSESPAAFLDMIAAYPRLATLELADCPGTRDDIANLRLGRLIRRHGLATVAPAGASIRSGAVDIFLAGSPRMAAPDARFAVHSWLRADGREAPSPSRGAMAGDPARAAYVRYYRDMGLGEAQAGAFYALTVSVPNRRMLHLAPRDLARFASLSPLS